MERNGKMSEILSKYVNTNHALATEGGIKREGNKWISWLGFEIQPNNDITLRTFTHIAGRRVEFDLPTWEELNGATDLKITVKIIK